ncbi:glutaredoxin family protein [bacterium]|nr:glutaredoxin family protein [bacterium]
MSQWTIYSKNQCPYCDKAKFALRDEPNVEVKNISEDQSYFAELMGKNPNARTMPQIFRDDQLIGGFDALEVHLATRGQEL